VSRFADVRDLDALRQRLKADEGNQGKILTVCCGTGCRAAGSLRVAEAFQDRLQKDGLEKEISLKQTGCQGLCGCGPVVVIRPQNIFYARVRPEDVPQVVDVSLKSDGKIENLLYRLNGSLIELEQEIPFYKLQRREVLALNGHVSPGSIHDYIRLGGYSALAKALSMMSPAGIVEEVKKAGLRGRGGGGFATGRKWESCHKAAGECKYLICNADEGDPGAFMDEGILEGNPHSVIEGMIIGAYAIGATEGYVYVRHEYPLAVQNLTVASEQARSYGLLGEHILGTDVSFDITISRGGGAFVCGESSALIASLEGKPGEPRAKYIHMAESGLRASPTLLNNVETWANVPLIINRGADWFRSIGNERSPGTKVFSLVGKVNNVGLVEVPMGVTLRHIIYDIGGGIPDGKRFKAVQTGGPSGGCLPEDKLDLPVDFDSLTEAGSMMGSGGMIVMDESICMVEVARYFTKFLVEESCGKCTPCREGLKRLLALLTDITQGRGTSETIALIEELCGVIEDGSLCALGTTAANPTLATLRYFRDEYVAHVKDKRCPAKVCRELITYRIDPEKCTGCTACVQACPVDAITGKKKEAHTIDPEKCTRCGSCLERCKFDAVVVE